MKKFYELFYHSDIKVRQAVALLPWGHILRLIRKVGNDDVMLFYAQKTIAVLLCFMFFLRNRRYIDKKESTA